MWFSVESWPVPHYVDDDKRICTLMEIFANSIQFTMSPFLTIVSSDILCNIKGKFFSFCILYVLF